MALTPQEANAREDLFLSECRNHGEVWVLRHVTGGLANWVENDAIVVPVWANRAGAEHCAVGDLGVYEAVAIKLASFIADVLPLLAQRECWIALHPDIETAGNQRPAAELAALIRAEGAA